MAGTKIGGQKAAAKNLAKDPNFYKKIGAKGGKNGRSGGFATNPELARIAGAKGGRISKRRRIEKAEEHSQPVKITVKHVDDTQEIKPTFSNQSGDNESGSNFSATSEGAVSKPKRWARIFGRVGSANR